MGKVAKALGKLESQRNGGDESTGRAMPDPEQQHPADEPKVSQEQTQPEKQPDVQVKEPDIDTHSAPEAEQAEKKQHNSSIEKPVGDLRSEHIEKSSAKLEKPPTEAQAVDHPPEPPPSIKKQAPHQEPASPPPPKIEQWDERVLLAMDKFSAVAESIRKVRTKILYPENGSTIRTIMVCSSSAGEGKSFICANLGISLAQSMERHALVVDCDLRRPTLQRLFGQNASKGLSDFLNERESLTTLLNKTGLDKLSILPSGHVPDNPSELISSDKMSAMLTELTRRYDDRLILLDTPPFHAASETLVLSQLVDKVVLVVRWGKSGRENIKKAIDLIGKEKILGIVFNAHELNILDRKIQGLGYHDYYTENYT